MTDLNRRKFLKVLGTGAGAAFASVPLYRAFAGASGGADEFFIFIHASGGWDVTLWSDPRNEAKGLVDPASTTSCTVTGVKRWVERAARRQRVDIPAGAAVG